MEGEKEGLSASTISPITLWDESGSVNMARDITDRELERIHVEVRRREKEDCCGMREIIY